MFKYTPTNVVEFAILQEQMAKEHTALVIANDMNDQMGNYIKELEKAVKRLESKLEDMEDENQRIQGAFHAMNQKLLNEKDRTLHLSNTITEINKENELWAKLPKNSSKSWNTRQKSS